MEGLLFVFGIAAVIGVFFLIATLMDRKRKEQLAETANELGLEYFPSGNDAVFSSISSFELFNIGRSRKHSKMISGETDQVNIAIFDYKYTTGGGKNSTTHVQSVISLQSPSLQMPRFRMRPERLLDKIGGAMGFQDIDFDTHLNFSKMFVLKGDEEQAIREFFNPELLSFFEQFEGYSVEGSEGAMILYRPRRKVRPTEIKDFLGTAYRVFGRIKERVEA